MSRISNSLLISVTILMFCAFSANVSCAADKTQLVAFVKKAVAYYKQNGTEKSFDEFSNPSGQFIAGELYIYAYDMAGNCVAHGANPKLIGQNLYQIQDVDGKYVIRELVEAAKKGGGFVEYRWKNPKSGAIEKKLGYVEPVDATYFVGSGIYYGPAK